MNPKKLIPILAIMMFTVITGACVYSYNILRIDQGQQPEISFTQEPTSTREEITSFWDTYIPATPTATELNYGSLPITQTVVVSMAMEAAAKSTIVASKSTQSAIDLNNDSATSTAQAIATNTAIAVATNAEIVRQEQSQKTIYESEQQRIIERQKAQDQFDIVFLYTWKVGGSAVIVILLICMMIFYVFRRMALDGSRKTAEKVSDNLLENIQPPIVQVSTDNRSGFEHVVGITSAEYLKLRKAVVDLKGRLSRRTIVRGGYFKEIRWNQIDDELLCKGVDGIAFFERNTGGGISPTEAGWKWLELTPPTPPQGSESVKSSQNTVIHHATPLHTGGE